MLSIKVNIKHTVTAKVMTVYKTLQLKCLSHTAPLLKVLHENKNVTKVVTTSGSCCVNHKLQSVFLSNTPLHL